jgi:hypothetical protein
MCAAVLRHSKHLGRQASASGVERHARNVSWAAGRFVHLAAGLTPPTPVSHLQSQDQRPRQCRGSGRALPRFGAGAAGRPARLELQVRAGWDAGMRPPARPPLGRRRTPGAPLTRPSLSHSALQPVWAHHGPRPEGRGGPDGRHPVAHPDVLHLQSRLPRGVSHRTEPSARRRARHSPLDAALVPTPLTRPLPSSVQVRVPRRAVRHPGNLRPWAGAVWGVVLRGLPPRLVHADGRHLLRTVPRRIHRRGPEVHGLPRGRAPRRLRLLPRLPPRLHRRGARLLVQLPRGLHRHG